MAEDKNIVEMAIRFGFSVFPKDLNPNNNWFGVSVYSPDALMTKGEKQIIISYQGMYMPFPKKFIKGYDEVSKNCDLRYIGFSIGNQIVYESYFGQLPPIEFIVDFIN